MPFTPAHPAIVLPFFKISSRFISATGLVVGSVTPDFEYFFKMSVSGLHSHTIPGLFYFDLPVGCFLAIVFHLVVKKRFIQNLPSFLQARLHQLSSLDFVNYVRKNSIAFLISVLIGAASHIFWDGFTHNGGFFVNRLSFYNGAYIPYDGANYPLWYALQHISTFIGLTVIVIYVLLMKPETGITYVPSLAYWIFILAVTVFVVLSRFGFLPYDVNLGNIVVTFISGLCLSVVFAGLIPTRYITHG